MSCSAQHRCFQRHGISRLPLADQKQTSQKKFKNYPIGYLHIDFAEVHAQQGKSYLFEAIEQRLVKLAHPWTNKPPGGRTHEPHD